jgi:riboflavin synthase
VFTGIVSEVGKVHSREPDKLSIIAGAIMKGIALGNSIAVNGTCLTVVSFTGSLFSVGISAETLKRTNLGILKNGDPVNLERPLGLGGELGGHLVQGHIDGTGQITGTTPTSGSTVFRFTAPPEIMRYIVEKGFIAVEGISLTVMNRGTDYFDTAIIDYTKAHTNLKEHRIGDLVNLEIDIMAKYAEQFIKVQHSNLTMDYLKDNGF